MKICTLLRSLFCGAALCCLFTGCDNPQSITLDQDDARVAGFYCDYLIHSGVAPSAVGVSNLAHLSSAEIDTLLARHYLTRESFNRQVWLYKRSPERWQAVLDLVQRNIRKKIVEEQ
jgi:hypothetical protein